MAPSPNRLTAAGTQTAGKHVRDVASSRPWILGGRHQPDYALTSGTFADTARPAGVWPLGPGWAGRLLSHGRTTARWPTCRSDRWPGRCRPTRPRRRVRRAPPRPARGRRRPAGRRPAPCAAPGARGGGGGPPRLAQRAGGGGLPGGALLHILDGFPSGDVPAPFLPHPVLVGGLQIGPRAGGGQPPRRRVGLRYG